MRLNSEQVRWIIDAVSRWAGTGAEVYLFGSRLNDKVSGGDVDILVEADAALSLIQRARIKMELESRLETFASGLRKTLLWYLENREWCRHVQDGSYQRERLGMVGVAQ